MAAEASISRGISKPTRLDLDPTDPNSKKRWVHWKKWFENFISVVDTDNDSPIDKLQSLESFVSFNVYEYIEEATTYAEAIDILTDIYVKMPAPIVARHQLFNCKQQPGQKLDEYLLKLRELSKDCRFTNVSADVYRSEMILQAFINGMSSNVIRQRLLENKKLDLEGAATQAKSLEIAQRDSHIYVGPLEAAAAIPSASNANTTLSISDDESNVAAINAKTNYVKNVRNKCSFCGKPYHARGVCPARSSTCYNCKNRGHWSKMCRFLENDVNTKTTASITSYLCAVNPVPRCLSYATVKTYINGHEMSTLMDSGSSNSYINKKTAQRLKLDVRPSSQKICMAQSTLKGGIVGQCITNVTLNGHMYKKVRLGVLNNLCGDVLLGEDFQGQHKRVIFEYNGSRPDLVVSNCPETCAITMANTDSVSLFSSILPNCKPIVTKSRRYNAADLQFIEQQVDQWRKTGKIRPSISPWRAQCLVVKSIDEFGEEKKRLCIDYSQTVNLFTNLDGYPLPRIDDMINNLAKYSVFSTFDLKSAYHQIPIPISDQPFTAFQACGKLWEFTVIPFGVTNGVPAFQRKMDEIVTADGLKDTFPYLDNITVAGRTQTEHDTNVKKFLTAMEKRNMILNSKKTTSSVAEINILGYLVGNGIIRPDPERLKPLREFPPPTDFRSLKRLLGLFAYYAKWIPDFSKKIQKLKNAKSFPLSSSILEDFNRLKKLIEHASLAAIDENQPFVVECDASENTISAVLNQCGRPVAFMSRSLQGSEKNYPSLEKEATAIIEAVRKWQHFLARQHFTLITDQRSVAFMFDNRKRTKVKNNKILCWRLELASFAYSIQYRPGKHNVVPDSLTRAFCASLSSPSGLKQIHDNLSHPGTAALLHFVRSKNLPYSTAEVKNVCTSCNICAEIKPRFYVPEERALIKSTKPFERINIDFKGPLPSVTRNKYLLVIIDEYSRFPFCFPCIDMSAGTVIQCFEKLFSFCGYPGYIHSDNWKAFISKQMNDYLLEKCIATSRCTPYHPTGNSQVERMNGNIWAKVLLVLKTRNLPVTQWEGVIPLVMHNIRSLLCTSTNATPHELFFNFDRRSPNGKSLPAWLSHPGPVFLRKFVKKTSMMIAYRKCNSCTLTPRTQQYVSRMVEKVMFLLRI